MPINVVKPKEIELDPEKAAELGFLDKMKGEEDTYIFNGKPVTIDENDSFVLRTFAEPQQGKTFSVDGKHLDKLDDLGKTFGRLDHAKDEVDYSGLIEDFIDRLHALFEGSTMPLSCSNCNQYIHDPRSVLPAKCPHCGSPLDFTGGEDES